MTLASLWTGVVHGQDAQRVASTSEAARQVQAHLGLYVTRLDRRDEGEQVYVRRERLEAWLLRPISAESVEKALCEGASWLLTGRLRASRGVGPLFEARPETETMSLIFYDVKTRVDPDRDGRYRQRRAIEPQARFSVDRARFSQLDAANLETQLRGADCVRNARVILNEMWVKEIKSP